MNFTKRDMALGALIGTFVGGGFMYGLRQYASEPEPQAFTIEFNVAAPPEEELFELDPSSTETERDSVTGVIRSTMPYYFGMREGISYKYDEQGRVTERMEYHMDLPDGEFTFWEEGELLCTGRYREGQLIELKRIEGDSVITGNFPFEGALPGIDTRSNLHLEI